MRAAGCPRVVIRRHMLLHASRNQCMAGSINARALKMYPEPLSLNNDGSDHANTPNRIDQPLRTARARLREGRRAGLAIPLQCLPGMEWTAGKRAQHGRGDAARGRRRRDDPAGDPRPGRSRSDDRDGRAHRGAVRRAAVREGEAWIERRQSTEQSAMSRCSAIIKPGTNSLSCSHTGRNLMAFRVLSLLRCPSPFPAA